jgi:hypothetical protein
MSDFTWALRRAGFVNQQGLIDRKKCIDFLQVSERTLERWMKDNKPCPRALRLLEHYAKDTMIHEKWKGFFVCRDGYLWTPDGDKFEPEFISKIRIMQRSAGYQQSQIMQQESKLENLKHLEIMKKEIAKLAGQIQNITTYSKPQLHAFELTLLDPQAPPKLQAVK